MRANKPIAKLVRPDTYPDGACKACVGGWKCAFHIAEDAERDRRMADVLRQAVAGIRQTRIARVCSRFELESDEFLTREQKAELMLAANPNLA